MANIDLIGVPFDGYGRPGNQALAAAALRDAGLAGAFVGHDVGIDDDLQLPAPDPRRGDETSLINETALLAVTDTLNTRIRHALGENRFPFVFGGDCSSLLGIITGVRDASRTPALVFVDGHEDTMPLDVSEDGEAANTEIGLLLGLTGRSISNSLADRLPALEMHALAMLGPRDDAWRRQFNVGSLRDTGTWLRSVEDVAADPSRAGQEAVRHVTRQSDSWWLHIDLDVLDPIEFPAQGLPDVEDEPGGLSWAQLTDLLVAAISAGGCIGASLVIYDPEQDPDGHGAQQIVRLVRAIAPYIT